MRFAALGEILFDCFPDRAVPGGAPANVCAMMKQFGLESFLVSAVGDDDLGGAARKLLLERGIRLDALQQATQPTGAVHVTLDAAGIATYRFDEDSAYDHIEWNETLARLAQNVDAVVWGTLAQRSETSRRTIERFLRETKKKCLRVFDVNLRSPFFNAGIVRHDVPFADVVKFNDDELPQLASFYSVSPADLPARLFDEGVSLAILSRGGDGAVLFGADGTIDRTPAAPVEQLIDTVGAGDAYTAVVIQGLLEHRPLPEINRRANLVAAHVCSCRGGTPVLPEKLRRF